VVKSQLMVGRRCAPVRKSAAGSQYPVCIACRAPLGHWRAAGDDPDLRRCTGREGPHPIEAHHVRDPLPRRTRNRGGERAFRRVRDHDSRRLGLQRSPHL